MHLPFRSSCVRVLRSSLQTSSKSFSTLKPTLSTANPNFVKIVEVGPRDGLQNEPRPIPPPIKAELINRLALAGVRNIEAGSFVSPKWVPQMAGTSEVLSLIDPFPNTGYSVLVPNQKGMDLLLDILSPSTSPDSAAKPPPPVTEVAIFTSATNAFSLANTNVSIAESLARLAPVARTALDAGLKVRGYVSVVVTCPFSGRVDPRRVRDVSRELVQMGCYEIGLGDTTGAGTPASVRAMLEEVAKDVDVGMLSGHFHDTNGTATANILTALDFGLRSFDASVGGLGGCPYSPGATGNVATEDVIYALTGDRLFGAIGEPYDGEPAKTVQSKWDVGPIDLAQLAEIGQWISGVLGRETTSRAGRALMAKRKREQEQKGKGGAKL
ncbi:aldolase [Rhizopogon vinicolor AM-OR11-026]|uniref:hydroxymethylglutaryl-CoA lyase n=1 Tax=Rhizopogon vinicolor AM-OR11-026 TaxID=1314800 RepID=A0A1B7NG38_9AGAM|nr:aldolase [Rhizopogon vinicolor AM-OR11-026]